MNHLSRQFDQDSVTLLQQVLRPRFFCVNNQFNEKTNGIAKSPSCHLWLPDSSWSALKNWHSGGLPTSLRDGSVTLTSVGHRNWMISLTTSIPNIQFTMQTELNCHFSFLVINIHRRPDGSSGHTVYRTPTHTNLCLNAESYHHPTNKHCALSTLACTNKAMCDQESLLGKLEFLLSTFEHNDYDDRFFVLSVHLKGTIHLGMNRHRWPSCPLLDPFSTALAGYYLYIISKL